MKRCIRLLQIIRQYKGVIVVVGNSGGYDRGVFRSTVERVVRGVLKPVIDLRLKNRQSLAVSHLPFQRAYLTRRPHKKKYQKEASCDCEKQPRRSRPWTRIVSLLQEPRCGQSPGIVLVSPGTRQVVVQAAQEPARGHLETQLCVAGSKGKLSISIVKEKVEDKHSGADLVTAGAGNGLITTPSYSEGPGERTDELKKKGKDQRQKRPCCRRFALL